MSGFVPASVHTSDLTAKCLRRRYYQLTGQTEETTQTALFRGQIGHWMIERWLEDGEIPSAADAANEGVRLSKAEGRPLSPALADPTSRMAVAEPARKLVVYMTEHVWPQDAEVVAVEAGVRWTIDMGEGEDPMPFESHVDVVFLSGGRYHVWDWKFREQAPTWDYLGRDLQLATYAIAVERGEVDFPGIGWAPCGASVVVSIVDMMRCKPYAKSGNGYQRGDTRPPEKIVVPFMLHNRAALIDALRERVRLIRSGVWPTSPDPIGCMQCAANHICPAFCSPSGKEAML